MLATGVAQPDDQPVNWRPTAKGAQSYSSVGGAGPSSAGRLACAGLADELGLGFDLGLLLGL